MEVGHLLGVGDAYKYIDQKLVKDAPNLMGTNAAKFNLDANQITEIALNAIWEMGLNKEQADSKIKPQFMNYTKKGNRFEPNWQLSLSLDE